MWLYRALKTKFFLADEMAPVLSNVAEELLKEVKKAYQETSQIPDELLLALKFVFGPSALHALDLVDQRSVTCVTSPSGRRVFQVVGSSGRSYTCYSSCHYCPCPAFAFSVLRRNDSLLCKHILATYLSQAMGLCQELALSDQQLTDILLEKTGEKGRSLNRDWCRTGEFRDIVLYEGDTTYHFNYVLLI